jgi:hypothetical protein
VIPNTLIHNDRIPDGLLVAVDRRDLALWIRDLPRDPSSRQPFEKFVGLPWRLILSEVYDAKAFKALEAETTFNDPMTHKRGFAQIIDNDPTRTELPERCLPVYLLNGRAGQSGSSDFRKRFPANDDVGRASKVGSA